jgi:ABC-2 type transport system permease protein
LPAAAIPLASVVTSLLTFAISLSVLFLLVAFTGIAPSVRWLELVPLVGFLVVFTTAVSVLLSLLYVRYRDLKPIWDVCSRVLFFATPIFYPIEIVPETLQKIVMLNPLAVIITEARHAVIDPSAPSALAASGGPLWLAVPIALTAALLVLAVWFYRRSTPDLAERL